VRRSSDYEFSLLPALEKQLTDTSSILIESGWELPYARFA
jgi:hypothetical protein